MTEKNVRIPNAGHPIAIEPTPQRVVITAVGRVVADSMLALTLREAA